MKAGAQHDKLGDYELIERLAVGGTAEVFRARDLAGTTLVLKKVLPQYAEDPRFGRLFAREARIVASLQHPAIVSLRDFGEFEGTFYLALEHVDGADLGALLRRAQPEAPGLPVPPLAAFIVSRVADALSYVHRRTASDGTPLAIVHRDISPQNILISRDGAVKLTDFGIARSTLNIEQTTGAVIRGKLPYMAPEQTRPEATLDARTDIFGLGGVLYHLLLGRPPFSGKSEAEILWRVRQGKVDLDPSLLSPAARPLHGVLQRCLAAAPTDRFASADALLGELRHFCEPQVGQAALADWAAAAGFAPPPRSVLERRARELLGGDDDLPPPRQSTAVVLKAPNPSPAVARRRIRPLLWLGLLALAALPAFIWWRSIVPPPSATPSSSSPSSSAVATAPTLKQTMTVDRHDARSSAQAPLRADAASGNPIRRLTLSSRPPGANVTLDGRRLGITPLVVDAPRPPFALVLERAGHRRWSRVIRDFPAGGQLEVRLRAKPPPVGRLTINSVPWTRVHVDGRLIGHTPINAHPLPAGEHRIVLEDRHGRVLRSFVSRISAGHTTVHSFHLDR